MQGRANELRISRKVVGCIPTMGAFHEGHLSLIRRARVECDAIVVTLFVNPTQFTPGEDYKSYPRDLDRDQTLAAKSGADIIFIPDADAMYPPGDSSIVRVDHLTNGLCGPYRKSHFLGVTTVCAKLFNIIWPHKAYFGEKDYQQLKVVQKMTRDLHLPLDIIGCPTIRDHDGLALSSRNDYLSQQERQAATALYRGLCAGRTQYDKGHHDAELIRNSARLVLDAEPLIKTQYIEIIDAESLEPLASVVRQARIAVATIIGSARLIDNIALE